MTDRELLQQTLDTLRHLCLHTRAIKGYDGEQIQTAIDALKARLAQPEPAECDGRSQAKGEEHMNEQIKQLWAQAAEKTQGDSWEEQTKFMERYTQLIGRECLTLADSIRDELDEDGEKQQALGAAWVGLAIERHFMIDSNERKYMTTEPEPVAWISHNAGLYHGKPDESLNPLPLYTAPPKKEWVGLTDAEREEATGWSVEHIEAKLKEKNT